MSETPQFSVIVPLYNKRTYIDRAVDSVLVQTMPDFELIVVDDGSTDGSLDVLAGFDDSRLRIIRQKNMGGAGGQARNTGMGQARGTWFVFLDGDDMWLPNHLEEIARIIEHNPEPGLVSPRPIEAPDGHNVAMDVREISNIRRIDYFLEASQAVDFNNCSSSAIHREVFHDLGGFINVRSGPDLEFWARVALHFPVTISDRVTSIYYRGTDGNMEQIAQANLKKNQTINSLSELSPSVAMLCNQAEICPDIFCNLSIRAYVNGRLWNAMRGALCRGETIYARNLARFMLLPLTPKLRFYRVFVLFPASLLQAGIVSFRWLKMLHDRFKVRSLPRML